MPIETSMYQQPSGASLASGLSEGMRLGQMSRQASEQRAMRDAFAKNVAQGPDGQLAINRPGLLADMGKVSPEHAMQLQNQFIANDKAQLEFKREQTAQHMENLGKVIQLTKGVKDQAGWDAALTQGQKMGLDVSDEPKQFDPGYLAAHQQQALSFEQSLAEQHKTISEQIERQKAGIEATKARDEHFKTYGNPGGGAPGQPGPAAQPGAMSDVDPATLVRMKVPPARQEKALAEIKAAQDTRTNAPLIMKAFENAAKNLHGVDFIPGMDNADQKQLHALMGPTYADIEHTVRQAAMDNMAKNTTPQFGDTADTIEKKRKALTGYLTSKQSAPTNAAFGINLKGHKSTFVPSYLGKGTVQVKDPQGNIRAVPEDQVEAALAAKGTLVDGQ
jgi:hypothetical protein